MELDDVVARRREAKAYAEVIHLKPEFEETLGFYEATRGKLLKGMKSFAAEVQTALDRRFAWQQGRSKVKTSEMLYELEYIALRLQGFTEQMNNEMKEKTKRRKSAPRAA